MTDKQVSTIIEILGKSYPIRCLEPELNLLQQAAAFLNQKMSEVQDSGKAINLERIAIITALNIAHQFLQIDEQKSNFVNKISERLTQLQNRLDIVISPPLSAELIHTTD
jgi:cell division protein ZapA